MEIKTTRATPTTCPVVIPTTTSIVMAIRTVVATKRSNTTRTTKVTTSSTKETMWTTTTTATTTMLILTLTKFLVADKPNCNTSPNNKAILINTWPKGKIISTILCRTPLRVAISRMSALALRTLTLTRLTLVCPSNNSSTCPNLVLKVVTVPTITTTTSIKCPCQHPKCPRVSNLTTWCPVCPGTRNKINKSKTTTAGTRTLWSRLMITITTTKSLLLSLSTLPCPSKLSHSSLSNPLPHKLLH